jgi:hypothetical protein
MGLDIRDFADTVKMELAIGDIRRYQKAYIEANNVKGVSVKWKLGWFAIKGKIGGYSFYRPTEFRNMTDNLEKRVAPKER